MMSIYIVALGMLKPLDATSILHGSPTPRVGEFIRTNRPEDPMLKVVMITYVLPNNIYISCEAVPR